MENEENISTQRTGPTLWQKAMSSIAARERNLSRSCVVVDEKLETEKPIHEKDRREYPVTVKQKIHAIMEPGSKYDINFAKYSRKIAMVVSVTGFVAILTSVIFFLVESLPQFYDTQKQEFYVVETVCVVIFTVEIVLRFGSANNRKSFCLSVHNIIDLLAILPYYIDLVTSENAIQNLTFLRAVRLVRVLRVFKLGKFSESLQYVLKSLSQSLDALYLLFFLILLSTIMFSSAMYLAETSDAEFINGEWFHVYSNGSRKSSKFQSIPHSFWWALVTLCTVGYGDAVPESPGGKVVASITMLCGILVVAFPVILIGAQFNEIVSERKRAEEATQKIQDIQELRVLTNKAMVRFVKELGRGATQVDVVNAPSEILTTFVAHGIRKSILSTPERKALHAPYADPTTKHVPLLLMDTFTYEPLFRIAPPTKTTRGGDLMIQSTSNPMLWVINFSLILDTPEAQAEAFKALCDCGSPFNQVGVDSVFAREIISVGVEFSAAGDDLPITLLTQDIYKPREHLQISLSTTSEENATNLANDILHNLSLQLFVTVCDFDFVLELFQNNIMKSTTNSGRMNIAILKMIFPKKIVRRRTRYHSKVSDLVRFHKTCESSCEAIRLK